MIVPIHEFVKENKELDLDGFIAKYDFPFIVFHSGEQLMEDTGKFITVRMQAVQLDKIGKADFEYIVGIEKKEESRSQAFPLIFLGRTRNNDIQVRLPFISKLHCYFKLMPDGTTLITDGGSTNGTAVDSKPLQRRYSFPLKGGEEIIIGGKLKATFLHSKELFETLGLPE